jgi:hypothetical protein
MTSAIAAAWLDRFITRLGHLLPTLSIERANDIAQSCYPYASDLPPDEAAQICAVEFQADMRANTKGPKQ